jgi:hypothetical protein
MQGLSSVLIVVAALWLTQPAWGADAPTLEERAAVIDRVSKESDGDRIVIGHVSRALGIPVEKLRVQRAQTGLSWGELLVAYRVSRASGRTLEQTVSDFRAGKAWEAIAQEHKVDLRKLTSEVQNSQDTLQAREEDKGSAPRLDVNNRTDAPPTGPTNVLPKPGTGGPNLGRPY